MSREKVVASNNNNGEPAVKKPVAGGRPTRIPNWALYTGLVLFVLSLISGLMIWWGQTVNGNFDGLDGGQAMATRPWVVMHNVLNPFLCAFLGYMSCVHIRLGWQMKANRGSGVGMALIFGGLALTGMAIGQFGTEWVRQTIVWMHRIMGLLLPFVLAVHWIFARMWLKKRKKSTCIPSGDRVATARTVEIRSTR